MTGPLARRTTSAMLALAVAVGLPIGPVTDLAAQTAGSTAERQSGASGQQGAPDPQDPKPSPEVLQAVATDAGLDRIREGLEHMPSAVFNDGRLRFYAFVAVKQPTIERFLQDYDLINGPTRGGNPMTHQEFLNMVTPKELYGSGGIKGYEMLQFALVNWLGGKVIEKGIEEIKKARDEREVKEIRDRIDRELAAIRAGGGGGGE